MLYMIIKEIITIFKDTIKGIGEKTKKEIRDIYDYLAKIKN